MDIKTLDSMLWEYLSIGVDYMKRTLRFFALVLVVVCISSCGYPEYFPENDVWYCADLGIQISFEDNVPSYVISDNITISCIWENDNGSNVISILCQEENTRGFLVGEAVFTGACIFLDSDKMILREYPAGGTFTFIRIATE